MPQQKKLVDWAAVERDYSAGQLSYRAIATTYGISVALVQKKARAGKWKRDLTDRVRQTVKARLILDEAESVYTGIRRGIQTDSYTPRDDDAAVEMAATRALVVVREHRTQIRNARTLAQQLVNELQEQSDHLPGLAEALAKLEEDDPLRKALAKAAGLSSRAMTLRNLAAATKDLVHLERQAFDLDDQEHPATPIMVQIVNYAAPTPAQAGTVIDAERPG